MKSQCDLLKAAFNRGEVLTVVKALKRYGIYALSQRVGELKRQHRIPIQTEIVKRNGKHFAEYRL